MTLATLRESLSDSIAAGKVISQLLSALLRDDGFVQRSHEAVTEESEERSWKRFQSEKLNSVHTETYSVCSYDHRSLYRGCKCLITPALWVKYFSKTSLKTFDCLEHKLLRPVFEENAEYFMFFFNVKSNTFHMSGVKDKKKKTWSLFKEVVLCVLIS